VNIHIEFWCSRFPVLFNFTRRMSAIHFSAHFLLVTFWVACKNTTILFTRSFIEVCLAADCFRI
jgi:hypothetical protein